MYICRRYNIFIINFMRNRFFGMLATIIMGGAVMTGLTACECPDIVLAAADNAAQGAVAALEEAGITNMPIITGQDNSPASQALIKSGKQTMTIDKNLKDMANNTAQIVNSLINNTPITGSQTVAGIPTIYSKITVITKDDL